MRSMLSILAAGLLAVAPLSLAIAEDAVAPAVEQTQAAPAETMVHEFMLVDGTTKIYAEGTMVYTMDAEGKKTPLANGEHTLQDGTVVTVVDGVATGLPAAAPAAEGAAEETAPAAK